MAGADVQTARGMFERRSWNDAYELLAGAAAKDALDAEDLERLAVAAYMLGRDDEYLDRLEQAHRAHLEAGRAPRAARCAFWVGLNLMSRGRLSPAQGWFARAERALAAAPDDCVERGYLTLPAVIARVVAGDPEGAHAVATEAAAIAERFGDRDLLALAVHEQGHALIRLGRVAEGLRLLDETMVSVTAGDLSPVTTGIVYCNTIAFCQSAFELRRAREWTEHLTRWCDEQPDMVAHTGVCLVHRAEIMERAGAWSEALEQARQAAERFAARAAEQRQRGRALYVEGELHRLRGDLDAAERAYRTASRCGFEPQPGFALLRLEQGRGRLGVAAIRRALAETTGRLARVELLAAAVEILIAGGELDAADQASRELNEIAETQQNEAIGAMSSRARGEVALARGDPEEALGLLRDAAGSWQALDAPYEAARARAVLARACRALGDDDTAALELEAAREIFATLGATRDAARVEAEVRGSGARASHGLSPREIEVLRLVAGGATNKAIAADLVLSERTVDRHVSNILAKLRVGSRAAATAFAYEHDLV
jgi:DNA-binding CsgD family transcriptional regulator